MTGVERYNYAYDPQGQSWPARLLRQVPEQATVLELGPGPGAMTKVLRDRGHAVTVIENDPDALDALGPLAVEVVEADLDQGSWEHELRGRRFDAILACDVLEHLREPERVLGLLKDYLAPAGRVIISLPNVAYAGVLAALRLGVFDYTDKGLLDRTHLRFFTRRSFEKVLQAQGWMPLHWEGHRMPIEQSEFVWCWENLDGTQRQSIVSGWADFDVYQWMVVASPLAEAAAAELMQVRTEMALLQDRFQELRVRHEHEHESLLEHQKAFAEAREVISLRDREIAEIQAEVARQEAAISEQVETIRTLSEALGQSRGRGWLARLSRRLMGSR